MNCTGHISITEEAFRSLFSKCGSQINTPQCDTRFQQSNLNQYSGNYTGWDFKGMNCILAALDSLYAAQMVAAVDGDLSGHFLNSKQRYHFMVGSKESVANAFNNACQFIRDNTLSFVQETSAILKQMPFATAAGDNFVFVDQFGVRRTLTKMRPVTMDQFPYQTVVVPVPTELAKAPYFNPSRLARALHCLQDSFSPGHVKREGGIIRDVYIYSEQDHSKHFDHDQDSGLNVGSPDRKNAVEASVGLIELALTAAFRMETQLSQWTDFAGRWLQSSGLSQKVPLSKLDEATSDGLPFYPF